LRVPMFFQPVGEDQPRRVVVGGFENRLQEGVMVVHARHSTRPSLHVASPFVYLHGGISPIPRRRIPMRSLMLLALSLLLIAPLFAGDPAAPTRTPAPSARARAALALHARAKPAQSVVAAKDSCPCGCGGAACNCASKSTTAKRPPQSVAGCPCGCSCGRACQCTTPGQCGNAG